MILDEADYLNANSTQPALRNFMEEFSSNCGFILTCNFKNRIIEPLHSRCSVIDFSFTKEDKAVMAQQMFKRVLNILDTENITFDKMAVVEVVKKYFPDNRRILNELQRYSATGSIDSGILANFKDATINDLIKHLKGKDFTSVRKWVANNSDIECTELYRQIYDTCTSFMPTSAIPQLVLTLADYQYKAAFVADHEINTTACLTEIMINCDFE